MAKDTEHPPNQSPRVSFRLPRRHLARLDALAELEGRSRSNLTAHLVVRALEVMERERAS